MTLISYYYTPDGRFCQVFKRGFGAEFGVCRSCFNEKRKGSALPFFAVIP
jgi:hypothetical protein